MGVLNDNFLETDTMQHLFQKVPAPEELAAHGAQVVNSAAP